MASILGASTKRTIARAFKGKLRKGTIRRATVASVSDLGDVVAGTPQTFTFEGFREDYSAFYRKQAGIPDTDCKIVMIAGLTGTTPAKDDELLLAGQWFRVRRVSGDPADAAYECQCFETTTPDTAPAAPPEEWGSEDW